MMLEPTPQALLLAEAMKQWTTPKLATAVFVAEAGLTPEQCNLHQGEWIAEIARGRQQHHPEPTEAPQPALRDLHQAWHEMFSHFSTSVAYGEIALWGRLTRPLARQDMERLPFERAKHLLYQTSTNTILDEDRTYRDVVATRSSTTASWEDWARKTRKAAGAIPLATALREWTDSALLSEVCRYEREHTPYEMASLTTHLLLSNAQDLARPSDRRWMLGAPNFTRLFRAWEALESDVRARLVRGEFHLRGVMTKPRRELQVEILPGVWAADFVFDFHRNTVSFDDTRYVAVTATYGAAAEMAVTDDASRDGLRVEIAEQVSSTALDVPMQRPRGRKSAKTVIEAALCEYWDTLFPSGAPADPGHWTELARRLARRAAAASQRSGVRFPAEETVRKHLPEIYAKLLVEKGGASQSAQ